MWMKVKKSNLDDSDLEFIEGLKSRARGSMFVPPVRGDDVVARATFWLLGKLGGWGFVAQPFGTFYRIVSEEMGWLEKKLKK